MKYKATVTLEIQGVKLSLYSKFLWFWWFYEGGLKHLSTNVDGTIPKYWNELIDEHLNRWKVIHAGNIIVEDFRTSVPLCS